MFPASVPGVGPKSREPGTRRALAPFEALGWTKAMAASDDDEVDLGISLETVAAVVDLSRALQGKEETDPAQLSEDDNSEAALLQEDPEDMTEDALRQFISELNATGLAPGEPVSVLYDREDPHVAVVVGSPNYRILGAGVAVRVEGKASGEAREAGWT